MTADVSADDAKLVCDGLWKVFGPRGHRLVGAAEADLPREQLLADTGCVVAVRDVSFAVRPGEMFVIMGLSGSGKSTLVRCLIRLVEPTAGRVTIAGQDVTSAEPGELRQLRRHTVSMVFQHFGLLPNRRVVDNVAYGLEIQGAARAERRERANAMIELVGLGGFAERYPDELSGGMKQRVGLARALVNDPEVLLLDEPFSALDPLIRRDMQEEVCRLQQQMDKTMVFITHDLQEALRLGDRIAVMRDGAVVQIGSAAELLAAPADDYVRDFTRDVPRALVLRVVDVCTSGAGRDGARTVEATTLLRDAIPRFGDDDELNVVADHAVVGTIGLHQVLAAIAGTPLPADVT